MLERRRALLKFFQRCSESTQAMSERGPDPYGLRDVVDPHKNQYLKPPRAAAAPLNKIARETLAQETDDALQIVQDRSAVRQSMSSLPRLCSENAVRRPIAALSSRIQKASRHEIAGRMQGATPWALSGSCRRFGLPEVGLKRSPRWAGTRASM